MRPVTLVFELVLQGIDLLFAPDEDWVLHKDFFDFRCASGGGGFEKQCVDAITRFENFPKAEENQTSLARLAGLVKLVKLVSGHLVSLVSGHLVGRAIWSVCLERKP